MDVNCLSFIFLPWSVFMPICYNISLGRESWSASTNKHLTNLVLFLCSYSKPDQVIYSGAVKPQEKVKEFQEEIGPEIVQTIKVGR